MTVLDDTKFCHQLIITLTKFVIYEALLKIKTQEIPIFFFASSEKKPSILVRWRVLSNYLGMTCTVLLNCPIKAEIRAVDSQSDLRILL